MASTRYVHRGKRSWWSGDVKTLCGLTFRSRDVETPWFPSFMKACPVCEALHAQKRK